ncbi:MAG: TetR/AcrR family transcriptional regulator [Spirochaetales bacterium]|nr:TetR/AcrR family transcriptional regulator [Spirochaetales bacterium]
MRKRDRAYTRNLILQTAIDKFAENGFDSASISQIAKTAEVNQALIYYYFDSKQAILDEILNNFINTANSFLVEIAAKQYSYGSEEMNEQMAKYNSYMLENEKVLRLLLMESLKDEYEVPPIFRLIDFQAKGFALDETVSEMNFRGYNFGEDLDQHRVTEFFTGIMPTVIFSLFRDKWSSHFNLEKDELDKLFIKANEDTHSRHHKE